jgi:tripartite-type tricarboxylate transporter receptor subunit TctC
VSVGRIGVAFALGLLAIVAPAVAQDFPSRQIQVVIPFPPGGSADLFARVPFNYLAPILGHPIVFENKAGASGMVGAKAVINATPDGYTLLVSSVASVVIAPSLTNPPPFDPLKDLAPVTGIGTVPAVLVVNPSKGIRSFAELLQYARANPGKVNLATSGAGTIAHLAGELLMRETGIQIQPVHYRGGAPAVTDVLGGHADIMFSDALFFLEHIRAGRLLPLAVGMTQRAPSLTDVPTTAELGYPAILASNTYSLFAPHGTPTVIVDKLYQLIATALQDPGVLAAFARQEALPAATPPERFATFMREEAARLVPIAKAAGAQGN